MASPPCPSRIAHPTLVDVIDSPSTACTSGPTLVATPTSPPRVKRAPEASTGSEHSLLPLARHLLRRRRTTPALWRVSKGRPGLFPSVGPCNFNVVGGKF